MLKLCYNEGNESGATQGAGNARLPLTCLTDWSDKAMDDHTSVIGFRHPAAIHHPLFSRIHITLAAPATQEAVSS